jgi:hypothetical protein
VSPIAELENAYTFRVAKYSIEACNNTETQFLKKEKKRFFNVHLVDARMRWEKPKCARTKPGAHGKGARGWSNALTLPQKTWGDN